jgi:NitT/TauT family transport system ATP-binding protein
MSQDNSGGIQITGLSHHYYPQKGPPVLALRDVELAIPPRTFVSLVGASGCGKTTLLDILSGRASAQSGSVTVGGAPPMAGRVDTARMFARDALLPWRSSADNIDFALSTRLADPKARAERIARLLHEVGLDGFQNAYPRQLSQGMRQRVALARTFSLQSEFVFFDEPFGAIDALTKVALQDQLVALWEQSKCTVVLVTHDLAEAVAMSDRVIVMSPRPGTIIADYTIDLPRPRNVRALQSVNRFHEYVAELWSKLG